MRKKAVIKLQNSRLMQIRFHKLYHWKGAMKYHEAKNPGKSKQCLGTNRYLAHKSILTLSMPYLNKHLKSHVEVAQKPEEIKQLLEIGFEYIYEKTD